MNQILYGFPLKKGIVYAFVELFLLDTIATGCISLRIEVNDQYLFAFFTKSGR